MNSRPKSNSAVIRRISKIMVLALITMLGATVNPNLVALDCPPQINISIALNLVYDGSSPFAPVNSAIRRVTAYNVGDRLQTDSSPCIGAGREDLCHALTKGEKVCAANFVPLNTYLYIQNYGICRVADRMSKRFEDRVDIAMEAHERHKAVSFGIQTLAVVVLD